MERTLAEFIAYLHTTKNTSANTEISYQRDLKKLIRYLQEQKIYDFNQLPPSRQSKEAPQMIKNIFGKKAKKVLLSKDEIAEFLKINPEAFG